MCKITACWCPALLLSSPQALFSGSLPPFATKSPVFASTGEDAAEQMRSMQRRCFPTSLADAQCRSVCTVLQMDRSDLIALSKEFLFGRGQAAAGGVPGLVERTEL